MKKVETKSKGNLRFIGFEDAATLEGGKCYERDYRVNAKGIRDF
jgi:hypothetical protein